MATETVAKPRTSVRVHVQKFGTFLSGMIMPNIGAFIAWERRAPEPLIPLRLLRRRTMAAAQLALFSLGAATFGTVTFVPLFVQGVPGESATTAGAVPTPRLLPWGGPQGEGPRRQGVESKAHKQRQYGEGSDPSDVRQQPGVPLNRGK